MRVIKHLLLGTFGLVLMSLFASSAKAQTPASFRAVLPEYDKPLTELTKSGEHYEVMKRVFDEGEPIETAELLAAARSAWSLGLADQARGFWRRAYALDELSGGERHRAALSNAVLELQEGNYDDARRIAERVAHEMEPSNLRSQFWLLIGDSLKAEGALGVAESYYERAFAEATGEQKAEARYLLAQCAYKLGKIDFARTHFVQMDMDSEYTPHALWHLVKIDLEQMHYKGVETWIDTGRAKFPAFFETEFIRYAAIAAYTRSDKLNEAAGEIADYRVRYTTDNAWLVLAEAEVEAALAAQVYFRARLEDTPEQSREVNQ